MKAYRHTFRFWGERIGGEHFIKNSATTTNSSTHPGSPSSSWQVPQSEVQHMRRVLRLKEGDEFELCDGAGWVSKNRLRGFTKNGLVHEQVGEEYFLAPIPTIALYVTADILNVLTRDSLLASLTELGVQQISWLARKPLSRAQNDRLHRLLICAIKQCKSPYLPQLCPDHDLSADRFLADSQDKTQMVVLDPEAPNSLLAYMQAQRALRSCPASSSYDFSDKGQGVSVVTAQPQRWLFILGGPAGWSPGDIEVLGDLQKAHLGPHILRVPTAMCAVVAVARQVFTFSGAANS